MQQTASGASRHADESVPEQQASPPDSEAESSHRASAATPSASDEDCIPFSIPGSEDSDGDELGSEAESDARVSHESGEAESGRQSDDLGSIDEDQAASSNRDSSTSNASVPALGMAVAVAGDADEPSVGKAAVNPYKRPRIVAAGRPRTSDEDFVNQWLAGLVPEACAGENITLVQDAKDNRYYVTYTHDGKAAQDLIGRYRQRTFSRNYHTVRSRKEALQLVLDFVWEKYLALHPERVRPAFTFADAVFSDPAFEVSNSIPLNTTYRRDLQQAQE